VSEKGDLLQPEITLAELGMQLMFGASATQASSVIHVLPHSERILGYHK
jgi:hypothetical protein